MPRATIDPVEVLRLRSLYPGITNAQVGKKLAARMGRRMPFVGDAIRHAVCQYKKEIARGRAKEK